MSFLLEGAPWGQGSVEGLWDVFLLFSNVGTFPAQIPRQQWFL